MPRSAFRVFLSACVFLTGALSTVPAAQTPGTDLSRRLDSVLSKTFTPEGPGAAVIVVKDGNIVFRRGYGLANLETKTAMRPEMVFELGSITKQFTSTAILMLAEERKLSLSDDIKKFFPGYPDKGAQITVEHLLTHTSGIKSYTEDPNWPSTWREDLTPQQVIDITKDAPLDFTPGTKWSYNNTAYTMLGVIIEKTSGVSYADFIRERIFEPLGMSHSLYGSFTRIIPNRAAGYTRGVNGWENAPYLSMMQPYSAGALMSNVDDLALWEAAVSSGRLLSKASWDRAFASFKLTSGEDTEYGYAWQRGDYEGRPVVHHGGGIPGYASESLRMPEDRTYVAVLANSDDPPIDIEFLAVTIAGETIGRPYREPNRVDVPMPVLDTYVGVYQIDENTTRTITREGTGLFMQRTGGAKVEILPSGAAEFFRPASLQRLSFVKDPSGNVVEVVSRTLGSRDKARKTDKPVSGPPKN